MTPEGSPITKSIACDSRVDATLIPMKKFENIQAITFDVGNTLLRPYPSVGVVMSEVLQRFGHEIPATTLDREMGAFNRYYTAEYNKDDSFWAEEARQREMWINGFAQVCRSVGIERDLDAISQACYDEFDVSGRWKLFEGVEATLAELQKRGYRMGIISNWGVGLAELLDDIGVGQYFETVTASAAAGVHKPMPHAFYVTLDAMGVLPDEAVHVGDHLTADVEGSAAIGMHPVLVRYKGFEDPTAGGDWIKQVPVITKFPQLLDLL